MTHESIHVSIVEALNKTSFWSLHIGNVEGLPPFLESAAPKASMAMFDPAGHETLTRFCSAFFSASGYLGSSVIDPEKSTRITTSAALPFACSWAFASTPNKDWIRSKAKNIFVNFFIIISY